MTGEMWKNKLSFRVVLNKADKLRESGAQVGVGGVSSGFFVPTMVSGILGFSAPVSFTPAPAAVSMAPTPVVEYGCGRVHNARAVAVIAAPASVVVHRASVCRVIRGIRVLFGR